MIVFGRVFLIVILLVGAVAMLGCDEEDDGCKIGSMRCAADYVQECEDQGYGKHWYSIEWCASEYMECVVEDGEAYCVD